MMEGFFFSGSPRFQNFLNRKNLRRSAAALLCTAAVLSGCSNPASSSASETETVTTASASSLQENGTDDAASDSSVLKDETSAVSDAADTGLTDEMLASLTPEMQTVAQAVDRTIYQKGFSLRTDAVIQLKGSLIKGEFEIISDTQVLRDNGEEGLCMTNVTESNLEEAELRSCYRNGIYRETGISGTKEIIRPEEEVWGEVTEITDMVIEAASSVTEVSCEQTGSASVYTYCIPGYIAKKYTRKVIQELNIEQLKNASAALEDAVLTTEIGSDGLVSRQTVSISGTVHKAIFKVPIQVEVTVDFGELDSIDFSEFEESGLS